MYLKHANSFLDIKGRFADPGQMQGWYISYINFDQISDK